MTVEIEFVFSCGMFRILFSDETCLKVERQDP
jgi:hypothetical protein